MPVRNLTIVLVTLLVATIICVGILPTISHGQSTPSAPKPPTVLMWDEDGASGYIINVYKDGMRVSQLLVKGTPTEIPIPEKYLDSGYCFTLTGRYPDGYKESDFASRACVK